MNNKKLAVYPGSFDPITNGHIDIINRALKIFDEVIVLVAINPSKSGLLSLEDRVSIIKEATKGIKGVKVDYTSGLSVNYAKKVKASCLIRGIRPVLNFEFEYALNASNEFINKDIDTIYFMSGKETSFISSSSIIELYKNKIDISKLVPPAVIKKLKTLKI